MQKNEDNASVNYLAQILEKEKSINQDISTANETAEKIVANAKSEVEAIKNRIISEAKEEREKNLAKGITKANSAATGIVEKAEKETSEFLALGEKYIDEAVSIIVGIILENGTGETK